MKRTVPIVALLLLARMAEAQTSCMPYLGLPCDGDPSQYECLQVTSFVPNLTGGESTAILQEHCFHVDSPLLGDVSIRVDGGTLNLTELEEGDIVGQIHFDVALSDFSDDECPLGDAAELVAPIRVSVEGESEVDVSVEIETATDPLTECLLIYDPQDEVHNGGLLMTGFLAERPGGGFELSLQIAELGMTALHPGLEFGDLHGTVSPVPLFFEPITRPGLYVLPQEGGTLSIETELAAENSLLEVVSFFQEETFEITPGVVSPRFVRGDANSDGSINLTDGVVILNSLFLGLEPPACVDAADVDDDGGPRPTLTDAIRIFNWLFIGGPAPAAPTPSSSSYEAGDCGVDETADDAMDCQTPPAKCAG